VGGKHLKVSTRNIVPWVIVGLAVLAVGIAALRGFEQWEHPPQVFDPEHDPDALVTLAPGQTDTVQFASGALAKMGYRLATVEPAPPPPPLRMHGQVEMDPNLMLRIKARFPGNVVEIADFEAADPAAPKRPLQFGDRVHKGQLLAVINSKEVGEKKSDLIDALSKLATREDILKRLEGAKPGAIAQNAIIQAKRDFDEASVDVMNARRTLESWQISDAEIAVVFREADRLKESTPDGLRGAEALKADLAAEKTWTHAELRSAIDGIIFEKNINGSDMVDPSDDLFVIADTSHVRIMARVYEEDLPTLRHLAADKRHWKIDLKADPFDEPVSGTFELVGGIIDPVDHTGIVMGTLENASGRMNLGQFVTATVDLEPDPSMVVVPAKAVTDVEQGSLAAVFVQDNIHPSEFTRRLVAITNRIPDKVCIRSEPNAGERAAGATSLKTGERVLASGVLELNNELGILKAAQPPVQAQVPRSSSMPSDRSAN
jgi:membrane fusion protein, heavy metal efflux system